MPGKNHPFTPFGHMTQFIGHDTTYGIHILIVEIGTEQMIETPDRKFRLDYPVALVSTQYHLGFFIDISFVFDLTNNLFKYIFDGN